MINKGELKLYYLEDRDYVNGLTLFEESMRLVSMFLDLRTLSNVQVQQFKMMSFIRTQAYLELFHLEDGEQRTRLRDASTLLDLAIEGVAYRALLFPAITASEPIAIPSYDRSSYVKEDVHENDGGSRAIIHNVMNSYELLRGIVEVNQRFTVRHAPLIGIPASKFWGYMTGYRFINPHDLPEEIEVNFSLKQVIPRKDITMIVREVSMPILEDVSGFDLCFFSGPNL